MERTPPDVLQPGVSRRPPLLRRRYRSSAFSVYAAFVLSEFNNLADTNQELSSPLLTRGARLCGTVKDQLTTIHLANEIWHPAESYAEVFELDRLNLRLMAIGQLRLRAFALLERYRTLFSCDELERITRVVKRMDRSDSAPEQEVRAQTDEVLASLHWYLLFSRARDRRIHELMRLSIFILLGLTTAALGCVVTKLLYGTNYAGQFASFLVFLLMGGLGAATSVAWRLQSLLVAPPTLPETHLTDLNGLKYGGQGVFVSVGCGVVFSFVLYMLFAGQVITGPLFPEITSPGSHVGGLPLSDFFIGTGPKDGKAYATLLVWLFLSGFAEKLVPDVLDRIRKGDVPRDRK